MPLSVKLTSELKLVEERFIKNRVQELKGEYKNLNWRDNDILGYQILESIELIPLRRKADIKNESAKGNQLKIGVQTQEGSPLSNYPRSVNKQKPKTISNNGYKEISRLANSSIAVIGDDLALDTLFSSDNAIKVRPTLNLNKWIDEKQFLLYLNNTCSDQYSLSETVSKVLKKDIKEKKITVLNKDFATPCKFDQSINEYVSKTRNITIKTFAPRNSTAIDKKGFESQINRKAAIYQYPRLSEDSLLLLPKPRLAGNERISDITSDAATIALDIVYHAYKVTDLSRWWTERVFPHLQRTEMLVEGVNKDKYVVMNFSDFNDLKGEISERLRGNPEVDNSSIDDMLRTWELYNILKAYMKLEVEENLFQYKDGVYFKQPQTNGAIIYRPRWLLKFAAHSDIRLSYERSRIDSLIQAAKENEVPISMGQWVKSFIKMLMADPTQCTEKAIKSKLTQILETLAKNESKKVDTFTTKFSNFWESISNIYKQQLETDSKNNKNLLDAFARTSKVLKEKEME